MAACQMSEAVTECKGVDLDVGGSAGDARLQETGVETIIEDVRFDVFVCLFPRFAGGVSEFGRSDVRPFRGGQESSPIQSSPVQPQGLAVITKTEQALRNQS